LAFNDAGRENVGSGLRSLASARISGRMAGARQDFVRMLGLISYPQPLAETSSNSAYARLIEG
jgi:hypothetical protein